MEKQIVRNIGIDFLRSLSIFYIVGFWHLFDYTNVNFNYQNFVTFRVTEIVLGTFVFISGFCLGSLKISYSVSGIFHFYKKRIIRIYPLYLLALIIFSWLYLSNLDTLIYAVLSVSMFIKPAFPTLWFISMIIVFYFLTPPAAYYINHRNSGIKFFLFFLLIFLLLVLYYFFTGLLDTRIVVYCPNFFLGLFISKRAKYLKNKNIIILFPVFLITVYLSGITTEYEIITCFLKIPMVVIGSWILFIFSYNYNFKYSIANNWIKLFSFSSYCMYLFHRPIYNIMKGFYFPTNNVFGLMYLFLFCLPFIIFTSYLIQKIFDFISPKLFFPILKKKNNLYNIFSD